MTHAAHAIRSFSQARSSLMQRGLEVILIGRPEATGSLMWSVNGRQYDKAGIIRLAKSLAATDGADTSTHTPEPWSCDRVRVLPATNGEPEAPSTIKIVDGFWVIAVVENNDGRAVANAERIVACVNALAGISTEALTQGMLTKLFDALSDVLTAGQVDGDAFVCAMEDIEALAHAARQLGKAQVQA